MTGENGIRELGNGVVCGLCRFRMHSPMQRKYGRDLEKIADLC